VKAMAPNSLVLPATYKILQAIKDDLRPQTTLASPIDRLLRVAAQDFGLSHAFYIWQSAPVSVQGGFSN
jgi:hypothetical protein